jgi:ribonuclease HI
MRSHPLKLFFDGGCRPNPGMMETAVVARGITRHRADLGHGTNNDAEWLALIHALEWAIERGATEIILVGDSAVVLNQAKGSAPCRSAALRPHLATFRRLAPSFSSIRFRQVGRSHNLAGIALERVHGRL